MRRSHSTSTSPNGNWLLAHRNALDQQPDVRWASGWYNQFAQSVTLSTPARQPEHQQHRFERDYAQTNNCPASLAASANCTISATFTPTTTGRAAARHDYR